MNKRKFIKLTFWDNSKVYIRADAIVWLEKDTIGKTCLYTVNNDGVIKVKESIDEVLAKIEDVEK
jgi:hypothetical protein